MDMAAALETIVGARVGVWWDEDETFYKVGFVSPCVHPKPSSYQLQALLASIQEQIQRIKRLCQ